MRNYAVDYAEAVDRLSGDVVRRDAIGAVTIHPVTADRLEDYFLASSM